MKPIWEETQFVGPYRFNVNDNAGIALVEARVYADIVILHDRKTNILAVRCTTRFSDDWDFDWRQTIHHCETFYGDHAQVMRHCQTLADSMASRVAARIPPDDLAELETPATQEA